MASEFTLEDHIPYLDLFEELELAIWIDGGWGVDVLLGEQTRPHSDLDFLIEKPDSDRLVLVIRKLGFIDVHTDDHSEWNFVMGTPEGKNFDFHVLEKSDDGNYTCGSPEETMVITASAIAETGTIGGKTVRCPTPEYMIDSHTGYTIKETDIHDVTALHQKFGVPLHPEHVAFLANRANV
jgi:lincosamide nucleotidyltransferase A/C/D/E